MSPTKLSGLKVVVIGGGTGSFVVLRGLKRYIPSITALVSMADDGGSTGQLRTELNVSPPGDVRQCLVALSDSPLTRDLFNYRFDDGSLKGHALGNIFLTALEKMTGSFAQAVEEASRVLAITGRVEPITLDKTSLVADVDGKTIKGEHNTSMSEFTHNLKPIIRLDPPAAINPAAKQAIIDADMIVIAPGALYTSTAPALIVEGVSQAIAMSRAKLAYVCNLVTKPGHTDSYTVTDYADEIERFLDGVHLDFVLYNKAAISDEVLDRYGHDGETPVKNEIDAKDRHYARIGSNLIARKMWNGGSKSDSISVSRTYIRHDSDKLARELLRLYFS